MTTVRPHVAETVLPHLLVCLQDQREDFADDWAEVAADAVRLLGLQRSRCLRLQAEVWRLRSEVWHLGRRLSRG